MKARVKATGEIIEVVRSTGIYDEHNEKIYNWYEVETLDSHSEDYWTRLEHQAAIGAMQGLLANSEFNDVSVADIAITSIKLSTSLIERLKEERK